MVIEQNMKNYPQDKEANEFRYLSPAWINAVATGLTAGAEKHPGETWRSIPAEEHAWRAVRHLILWLAGDREDKHLDNASMRVMMAWETDRTDWKEKGKEYQRRMLYDCMNAHQNIGEDDND